METDLCKKYCDRYHEFSKLDRMNLEQTAMRVPNEKHFYSTQLLIKKAERIEIIRKKNKLKKAFADKIIDEGVVTLSKKTLEDIESSDKFEEINEKIREYDAVIETLESIVRNITYIGQDIKNIITIIQLENGEV